MDTSSVHEQVRCVVEQAKRASAVMAKASTDQKHAALKAMAQALGAGRRRILEANRQDVDAARCGDRAGTILAGEEVPRAAERAAGLSVALVDRLTLTDARLGEMIASIEAVIRLPDPVGQVIKGWEQPNGLKIQKVRVPIGVIGIIYESRPNVTSECASLCVKSGNAVVLRGGAESFRSNQAIANALRGALAAAGLPEAAVSLIPVADRAGVDAMLELNQFIDVIIPRGGEALIRKIIEHSRIPVIKHAKGVCHVYVDDEADLAMAQAIAFNAKCQRPATCNAMETLLVHERVAQTFVPAMVARLQEAAVEVRGCGKTRALAPAVTPATEDDWSAEYLDLILAVKVVGSLDEAMQHIARYGSAHSDAIVTSNQAHAARFLDEVDSACVYVNASTRFTDGYQFGLGAEIGISTDRLHARGPMGLEELTTYKYVIHGNGQLRE